MHSVNHAIYIKYFVFLISEIKRKTNALFTAQQIYDFINTEEGQKGLKAFSEVSAKFPSQGAPKHIYEIAKGVMDHVRKHRKI